MKTFKYYIMPLFLLGLVLAANRCSAATSCGGPGVRACTDDDLNPQAALMRKAPLFAEAVRSVGHVCDRVTSAYLDTAPGMAYYHVVCDGRLHYTIGVSRPRAIVWAGDFGGM